MIDLHTHPFQLTDREITDHFDRLGEIPRARLEQYLESMEGAERAVALAFWAPASNIQVNNAFIATVVRHAPARLVGFACVHPLQPGAITDLKDAIVNLGLKGVKLAPIYQDFAPDDPGLWPFYETIEELGVPILWHQGTSAMAPDGPLEHARPFRLDKVARCFPSIKMVIAHFGYPWSREVVAMLRKRPNVYTDISAHLERPWFLYNALVDAIEYGAADKILFGSDYPPATPRATAAALREIGRFADGTRLPKIPDAVIEEIIERDSLSLLGITP